VGEEELRARFAREAKAAGRLVHPHVVTLFEAGEIEGTFFLAFEHVGGANLASRMRRPPPLTVDEAVRIGGQAASGLAAAHRRSIVHRDIKPSNLLLDEDGAVKISDFGIAKLAGAGTELTQSGSVIGTPQYLSPEQVRGEPLDGRSDLFSLGVVLYELLAGRRPFAGDTMTTLIYQILSREPEPIATVAPGLPPALAAAVMRLLAKDREERFPDAETLGEELRAIERKLGERRERSTKLRPAAAPAAPRSSAGDATELAPPDGEPAAERVAPSAGRSGPIRRRRRATLGAAVALVVLLGVAVTSRWWRAPGTEESDPLPAAAVGEEVPPDRGATSPQGEPRVVAPTEQPQIGVVDGAPPVESATEGPQAGLVDEVPTASRDAATSGEARSPAAAGSSPRRMQVGGAVTFVVAPAAAARRAVVKVDGLVRGPAAGSLLTLRPGEHRVEIVAEGFAPLLLRLESRPGGGAPDRLEVTLQEE
jgi:serine/threonine-protein kinase